MATPATPASAASYTNSNSNNTATTTTTTTTTTADRPHRWSRDSRGSAGSRRRHRSLSPLAHAHSSHASSSHANSDRLGLPGTAPAPFATPVPRPRPGPRSASRSPSRSPSRSVSVSVSGSRPRTSTGTARQVRPHSSYIAHDRLSGNVRLDRPADASWLDRPNGPNYTNYTNDDDRGYDDDKGDGQADSDDLDDLDDDEYAAYLASKRRSSGLYNNNGNGADPTSSSGGGGGAQRSSLSLDAGSNGALHLMTPDELKKERKRRKKGRSLGRRVTLFFKGLNTSTSTSTSSSATTSNPPGSTNATATAGASLAVDLAPRRSSAARSPLSASTESSASASASGSASASAPSPSVPMSISLPEPVAPAWTASRTDTASPAAKKKRFKLKLTKKPKDKTNTSSLQVAAGAAAGASAGMTTSPLSRPDDVAYSSTLSDDDARYDAYEYGDETYESSRQRGDWGDRSDRSDRTSLTDDAIPHRPVRRLSDASIVSSAAVSFVRLESTHFDIDGGDGVGGGGSGGMGVAKRPLEERIRDLFIVGGGDDHGDDHNGDGGMADRFDTIYSRTPFHATSSSGRSESVATSTLERRPVRTDSGDAESTSYDGGDGGGEGVGEQMAAEPHHSNALSEIGHLLDDVEAILSPAADTPALYLHAAGRSGPESVPEGDTGSMVSVASSVADTDAGYNADGRVLVERAMRRAASVDDGEPGLFGDSGDSDDETDARLLRVSTIMATASADDNHDDNDHRDGADSEPESPLLVSAVRKRYSQTSLFSTSERPDLVQMSPPSTAFMHPELHTSFAMVAITTAVLSREHGDGNGDGDGDGMSELVFGSAYGTATTIEADTDSARTNASVDGGGVGVGVVEPAADESRRSRSRHRTTWSTVRPGAIPKPSSSPSPSPAVGPDPAAIRAESESAARLQDRIRARVLEHVSPRTSVYGTGAGTGTGIGTGSAPALQSPPVPLPAATTVPASRSTPVLVMLPPDSPDTTADAGSAASITTAATTASLSVAAAGYHSDTSNASTSTVRARAVSRGDMRTPVPVSGLRGSGGGGGGDKSDEDANVDQVERLPRGMLHEDVASPSIVMTDLADIEQQSASDEDGMDGVDGADGTWKEQEVRDSDERPLALRLSIDSVQASVAATTTATTTSTALRSPPSDDLVPSFDDAAGTALQGLHDAAHGQHLVVGSPKQPHSVAAGVDVVVGASPSSPLSSAESAGSPVPITPPSEMPVLDVHPTHVEASMSPMDHEDHHQDHHQDHHHHQDMPQSPSVLSRASSSGRRLNRDISRKLSMSKRLIEQAIPRDPDDSDSDNDNDHDDGRARRTGLGVDGRLERHVSLTPRTRRYHGLRRSRSDAAGWVHSSRASRSPPHGIATTNPNSNPMSVVVGGSAHDGYVARTPDEMRQLRGEAAAVLLLLRSGSVRSLAAAAARGGVGVAVSAPVTPTMPSSPSRVPDAEDAGMRDGQSVVDKMRAFSRRLSIKLKKRGAAVGGVVESATPGVVVTSPDGDAIDTGDAGDAGDTGDTGDTGSASQATQDTRYAAIAGMTDSDDNNNDEAAAATPAQPTALAAAALAADRHRAVSPTHTDTATAFTGMSVGTGTGVGDSSSGGSGAKKPKTLFRRLKSRLSKTFGGGGKDRAASASASSASLASTSTGSVDMGGDTETRDTTSGRRRFSFFRKLDAGSSSSGVGSGSSGHGGVKRYSMSHAMLGRQAENEKERGRGDVASRGLVTASTPELASASQQQTQRAARWSVGSFRPPSTHSVPSPDDVGGAVVVGYTSSDVAAAAAAGGGAQSPVPSRVSVSTPTPTPTPGRDLVATPMSVTPGVAVSWPARVGAAVPVAAAAADAADAAGVEDGEDGEDGETQRVEGDRRQLTHAMSMEAMVAYGGQDE